MQRIESGQISVVVQGPIAGRSIDPPHLQLTRSSLTSVRRHLPKAQIILSTWRGSDVSGLDFDTLVESDDPGGVRCATLAKTLNNVNRQIVSTVEGLRHAERPYAMKLRSDMELTGNGFLGYFNQFADRSPSMRFLRQRVLGCTVYSYNPRKVVPWPFHVSDWVYFGCREDLLTVWDVPRTHEPETSQWFAHHARPAIDASPDLLHRYSPEQWIWINFLRKFTTVELRDIADLNGRTLRQSELSIANNVTLLSLDQWNLKSLKHNIEAGQLEPLYGFDDWLELYQRYCQTGFKAALRTKGFRPLLGRLRNRSHLWMSGWAHSEPATFKTFLTIYQTLRRLGHKKQ